MLSIITQIASTPSHTFTTMNTSFNKHFLLRTSNSGINYFPYERTLTIIFHLFEIQTINLYRYEGEQWHIGSLALNWLCFLFPLILYVIRVNENVIFLILKVKFIRKLLTIEEELELSITKPKEDFYTILGILVMTPSFK